MAEITVLPAEFTMVFFDASRIAALAEQVASDIGLPADLAVTVEVQEDSPLGRRTVESADPAHVSLESGAVEDPQNPRQLPLRA